MRLVVALTNTVSAHEDPQLSYEIQEELVSKQEDRPLPRSVGLSKASLYGASSPTGGLHGVIEPVIRFSRFPSIQEYSNILIVRGSTGQVL